MQMWLLFSIIILLPILYSVIMFLLTAGISRLHKSSVPVSHTAIPVAVVVPFRDEEEKLPGLIMDLLNQQYPAEKLQFVFVNDHSGDRSAAVLNEYAGKESRITCLELSEGLTGKKAALKLGIRHAGCDRIIQTDADCRVGPRFVSSHMAFLDQHPCDMVAGMVTTSRETGRFLEVFERMDQLGLVAAGAGSFQRGRPLMCSGANLAYSRQLFMETRNHEPHGEVASGDDMFLMIGARKMGRSLRYNPDRDAMVMTAPVKSWAALADQRIRWGAKSVHYRMTDIQLMALLVVLTNLVILAIPVLVILLPASWPWMLTGIAIKSIADFTVLFRITGATGQRRDLGWFLPVWICYHPLQLLIYAGTLFRRPGWKGRGARVRLPVR